MAAPLPTENILGVFKALKDDIQGNVLRPRGLSMKSTGTKSLELKEPTDSATGFWSAPNNVSSKPPRWIVQVKTDTTGTVEAQLSADPQGKDYSMAKTIGYINNRDGSCAVIAVRVLISAKPQGSDSWVFPEGWECLFLLGFSKPLPAGTSGDPLTEFDSINGAVSFGGGAAKKTYPISLRAIVGIPGAAGPVGGLDYATASAAVAMLAGATFYDGTLDSDRDQIVSDLEEMLATTPATGPFVMEEDTALVGVDPGVYRQIEAAINSGKRHIILYGPPGTGKTTLAEYLARELSERDDGDGSYLMLTASSSWSAQDLVGGYQPIGGGGIGFIPGALLRNFDKPAIIDELNRCPIDKVLGPLFSVLSGQSSTLPCRVDIADPDSSFHVILPEQRENMAPHEHAPSGAWRLVCTLNTYDKTQLGQISYALSRRFAWIKVGAPNDLDAFVIEMASRLGFVVPAPIPSNPVGAMWNMVNIAREIGGAPIVDTLKILRALDGAVDPFSIPEGESADIFLAAFRMCVLPLMDGLSPREAKELARGVAEAWSLDAARSERLGRDCAEFAA